MVLVIGGIASGKRTYIRSLGFREDDMSLNVHANSPVLSGLEEVLRQGALSADEFDAIIRKDVVACCEVGQGVVPLDAADRAWRELVGRTWVELAKHADKIVRMVCGIPTVIR